MVEPDPGVSVFSPPAAVGLVVAPTARPRAAAAPPATTTKAATMPVTAPADRTVRRATTPEGPAGTGRRVASQVSRAGAPPAPPRASGVQAKRNTMSDPVKYGDEWKLTVRKSPKERTMPATAATRTRRPASTPAPMATSPMAMTTPTAEEMGTR